MSISSRIIGVWLTYEHGTKIRIGCMEIVGSNQYRYLIAIALKNQWAEKTYSQLKDLCFAAEVVSYPTYCAAREAIEKFCNEADAVIKKNGCGMWSGSQ